MKLIKKIFYCRLFHLILIYLLPSFQKIIMGFLPVDKFIFFSAQSLGVLKGFKFCIINLSKISFGVCISNTFFGLLLSLFCTFFYCFFVIWLKSVPFGKYCLISPSPFSSYRSGGLFASIISNHKESSCESPMCNEAYIFPPKYY